MHWLDLKGWLSVVGLVCDLIGAGMLAIPMLSSAERVALRLERWRVRLDVLRKWSKAKVRSRLVSLLFSALFLVTQVWVLIAHALADRIDVWTASYVVISAETFFVAAVGFGAAAFIYLLMLRFLQLAAASAARTFSWVSKGENRSRERKMGWIGYGILSVGFTLQAVVNFL